MSTPSAMSGALPERGEIFDGKYRIDGVLGIDGMGALLAATRLERNERVAIKVLLPDSAPDAVVGHSTLAGLGSSRIRSDYVARSCEAGIHRGRPYLVVEYPTSLDPHDLVDQGGFRVTPPLRASERLAGPAPPRTYGRSQRTSVPRVPMRSAVPGYSLAGMAIVAIVATTGWAIWHQGRALHEAETRTEAATPAPVITTPVPAVPPPTVDTAVTTTSAVVDRHGSTEPSRMPVSAATPPAPSHATPPPRHHHAHPKPTRAPNPPPAQTSAMDNPYAAPTPTSSAEPGSGTNLFEIRK